MIRKNYFNFKGRTRRRDFWIYIGVTACIMVVLIFLDSAMFPNAESSIKYGPLSIMYGLVMFSPSVSICIRRLHDVGLSGNFIIFSFVKILILAGVFFYLMNSQSGSNKWGPSPKATK
ncbi:DUF805 domain-containing protein [Deinococcus sp. KNUC1210]|uniref:DUF805 domain-containing protein n=1 Tax=Deinococcus sp. KNUC1210 TaxID=2917691 RepID=UPI00351DA544